jgi:type IX secretion system PorP/SprF family membrane protein
MKKIVLVMMSIASGVICLAQQKPHYTQYVMNQYILNPAITGIENYTDIKLSHRHQWVGFEDAPVTTYFTMHKPIGKSDYRTTATSFGMDGENPRGKSYWEEYTAAEPHHGVGFQVINDKTGPISYLTANLTYAYHLGLSPKTNLSAGFGVGVSDVSLMASKLAIYPVDQAVFNTKELRDIKPDISAGLYLYSADYFVGLSAQQIIPQKIIFKEGTVQKDDAKMIPHIFATAGYRFSVGYDFNFIPSVMIKYVQSPQFEINTKLQYQDKAWAAVSYRQNDAVAGMVGLNVSNTFNVGYSYDYTTNSGRQFLRNTHELMLGFLIGNKYGDTCPRNVW